MLKRATDITGMLSAFPQAPLTEDEFKDFYISVDKERDACLSRTDELEKKLYKDNVKILFAGHRGSGKSTELNRLVSHIAPANFVVRYSVTEELDVNDLNYLDLVMVTMEQLADQAVTEGVLDQDSPHIKKIRDWLCEVTEIKADETGYMLEAEAGLKTKRGILTSLIGVFAEFKASIKAAGEKKTEYRKKLEQKISLLKAYCNILINEITMALQKQKRKLLIIIEDIDKAETALTHEIFFKHSGILSELNTRIIFTVSIFTLTTPELASIRGSFEDVRLPMLKTKEKDGSPCEQGMMAITKIVEKRADLSLFDAKDKVLDLIIERSGGVLRDLFEMIEIAANCASMNKLKQIDRSCADYAFERLKSKYRGMITVENIAEKDITTKGLYKKLVEMKDSKTKEFPLDKEILILLSCLAVVEYNGTQWFDVHPAVKSILDSIDLGKANGDK